MMALMTSNLFVLAQSLKPGTEQAPEPSMMSPWLMGALVVSIILVPFGLGTLLGKMLKMKDLSMKFGVVLLTLELGLAPFVSQYVIGAAEQSRYNKQLKEWETKQAYRDKISKSGIEALKSAVPAVQIIADEKTTTPDPKTE